MTGLVVLIIAGAIAYPFARVSMARPTAIAGELPPAQAKELLQVLLKNVYRAFDFRDEEVVFDRLAQSFTGDVLERVYLEMRKGLRLENQGGARVRIREVRLIDLQPEEAELPGTVRYRAKWLATGSVGHWGHIHTRRNRYAADLVIRPEPGREDPSGTWESLPVRLAGMETGELSERRLNELRM